MAQNLTLHALASRIGFSPQHLSEVELAHASASEEFVWACDRALGADGRLLALYPAVVIEQVVERQKRSTERRGALPSQEVDDVRRRAFIGLGLAFVLLGPEAAARASKEDWDRIAHAWSFEIATAPDRSALLPGLAADLKNLHANGGPDRAVAQLSSYVASIAVTSGDTLLARRWWKRTRAAAAASRDSHLIAYVGGQQAVQGLYAEYTPARVIMIADQALAVTRAPCAGRMHALGAKAQAHAMLGRTRQARDAMRDLEALYERLPRDLTRERISALGWPEQRLHHTASYVAMYTGEGGESAREEALRLYTDATWRGPAQVRLHRAASLRRSGDVTEGLRMAAAVLKPLSEAQRNDRFIVALL